jgi:O-antigen ligase
LRFPRLLAGFLALAPLVVLPGLHDFANLPQSAFVQVGASFLLLLFCWRPSARVPFGAAPFDVPLLAFGLWSAASLLWAHTRYPGAELALGWLACGVVYGLVSRSVARPEDEEALLGGVLVSGVLVAALGLSQQFFDFDLVPQAGPPAATLANRNLAAELLVLALPVAIVRFLRATELPSAARAAFAGALMGGYLFHTRTRSAWLAVALELLVLATLGRRLARAPLGKAKGAVAVAGLTLAALLMSITPEGLRSPAAQVGRLADQGPASPKARSVDIRLAVWREAVEMVRDRPLAGVGLGNLEVYYPAYARSALVDPVMGVTLRVDQAHNEYLQVAAELGLVGMGLLVWLSVRVTRLAMSLIRHAEPETAASVLAAAGGLVGLGVDAFFSFPLHRALPPLVAAAYLGLLATAASPAGGREAPAPGPRWRIAAAALALLGVLAWSERRLRGDHHVLRMLRADAASEWTRVIEEGAAARRANPFPTLAPFRVASAHLRRGEPGEALPPLERIVADYPYHVGALGNLGIARLDSGDLAGARECFARVLALVPDDGLSHYNLGLVLERMGYAARASEELGKAVAADPENAFYREALRRVTGGAPSPGVH